MVWAWHGPRYKVEQKVSETMNTNITREQIKSLRSEAYAAGDYVQAAICEVAMDRWASAGDLCDQHEGLRTRLRNLGVSLHDVHGQDRARSICADVISKSGR